MCGGDDGGEWGFDLVQASKSEGPAGAKKGSGESQGGKREGIPTGFQKSGKCWGVLHVDQLGRDDESKDRIEIRYGPLCHWEEVGICKIKNTF